MEDTEFEQFVDCYDCGAAVASNDASAYVASETVVLCEKCATRRGGVFEAMHDRWMRPPDVADVPDERRPHA